MKNLNKTSLLLLLLFTAIIGFPQVKTNHFEFNGGPCCEIWTIYIGVATLVSIDLEAGDEIAIFDGEIMVGAMELTQVCTPDNQFDNALPAFSLLHTGLGYTPGNAYSFKAWDESAQVELNEFVITMSDPYGGAWVGDVFPPGDGQYSMIELEFIYNINPIMNYNPTYFTQLIEENSTAQDFLNIISAGYGELIWNIEIVYPEKSDSGYKDKSKDNWLDVSPIEGTLQPGENETATVEFNSNGLELGTYNANITIYSNDENNPEVIVPVTMIVEGQPEPHFNFEGGDPSSPIWIIYLSSVKTAYPFTDLVAGDEIAIYDGDLMVGVFTLDQVCTPDNQFENDLLAFSVLNTQAGYQAGNEFSFKAWDASEQKELDIFIYEFLDPYGDAYVGDVFPANDGEFSITEIVFPIISTQFYNLVGGYQFISSNIIPDDPELTIVLSEILSDNLDFVRNSEGLMLRKIGSEWINGIGDWVNEEAYLIHMYNEDSFSIEGFIIDPEIPIQLSEGYQMLSYFPVNPANALEAFQSIIGDNLDFVRNSQGNTLHKIGPNWINGIGNCNPGEGYLIKMFNPEILTYSANYSFACGGLLVDPRDNQIYNTVQIGDQCWMTENLNIGTMINGSTYMTNNNVVEKYCYNNAEGNCDEFGGLYQWDEMMQYTTTESTQGICPDGWHLPSDAEWFEMENYLDPSISSPNITGWRGIDCGLKMLEGGSSGFEGLLSGYKDWNSSVFLKIGDLAYFRSTTLRESESDYFWYRSIENNNPKVYRNSASRFYGFSVRCLLDETNSKQTDYTLKNSKAHFLVKENNPSESVWTIYLEKGSLNIGDEIAVFDGEILTGSGFVISDNIFENEIPVFSNLYKTGNKPIIKVWNKNENKEYNLTDYTFSNPYGDAWIENVFPAEDGEYSLLNFSTTGIPDENAINDISIYPNPTTGIITIGNLARTGQVWSIEITDITGKIVFNSEKSNNSSSIEIDLSHLEKGIYFMSLNSKDFKYVNKIVIQ